MKKLGVYLLICLVSCVSTYESILILADAMGHDSSYTWIDTMECSDKKAKSEEAKEQKEKIDFLEHFYFGARLTLAQMDTTRSRSNHDSNFSSSDHSQTIYSPPEEIA